MTMTKSFGTVIVVAAIALATGCKSNTSDGDGGGGNPGTPTSPNTTYISPNPASTNIQVRKADQRTLSGRELKVSMTKFQPGQNVSLAGNDIFVTVKAETPDKAPIEARVLVELTRAETPDSPSRSTPFWDGLYEFKVNGAEGERRIGVPNKGGVDVNHVVARVWALEGLTEADGRFQDMPEHGRLVSELIRWRP